jgi:hypothetical protein
MTARLISRCSITTAHLSLAFGSMLALGVVPD